MIPDHFDREQVVYAWEDERGLRASDIRALEDAIVELVLDLEAANHQWKYQRLARAAQGRHDETTIRQLRADLANEKRNAADARERCAQMTVRRSWRGDDGTWNDRP